MPVCGAYNAAHHPDAAGHVCPNVLTEAETAARGRESGGKPRARPRPWADLLADRGVHVVRPARDGSRAPVWRPEAQVSPGGGVGGVGLRDTTRLLFPLSKPTTWRPARPTQATDRCWRSRKIYPNWQFTCLASHPSQGSHTQLEQCRSLR